MLWVKKDESKIKSIINPPQFEKMVKNRNNAKHTVLKEEERVISTLNNVIESGCISDDFFKEWSMLEANRLDYLD